MTNTSRSKADTRAAIELVFAASLWGFGFIAAIWALRGMGPLSVTGWRFAIASLAGLAIALVRPKLRQELKWDQFFLAAIPGLFISATLVLQTWGLQYTTATKSSFVTTLYVLIVPVLEVVWLKKRLPKRHLIYVSAALIGTALICQLPLEYASLHGGGVPHALGEISKHALNIGDWLTLACAVFASLHILWFELIHERIRSPFVFNLFQSLWAGALPLALCLIFEPLPRLTLTDSSLIGLFALGIGSSLIAFMMQIRAQKVLPPSMASLLFLLESPFATFFAIAILDENLVLMQWIGAAMILLAAGLSVVFGKEAPEMAYDV